MIRSPAPLLRKTGTIMLYEAIRDISAKRTASRLAVNLHLITGYLDMSDHNGDHDHERVSTRSQRPAIDVTRHNSDTTLISMEFVDVYSYNSQQNGFHTTALKEFVIYGA